MHEASIVQYALQSVERAAKANHLQKVTEITLVIGKIKVAIPDILRCSFDLLTVGTICEGAKLVIEERDAVIHCNQCGSDITIHDFSIEKCPNCNHTDVKVIQGNELMIAGFKGY